MSSAHGHLQQTAIGTYLLVLSNLVYHLILCLSLWSLLFRKTKPCNCSIESDRWQFWVFNISEYCQIRSECCEHFPRHTISTSLFSPLSLVSCSRPPDSWRTDEFILNH